MGNPAHVFISYRSQDPDQALAKAFYATLQTAGHQVFMAAESIRFGDDWSKRIDLELERCDYFLLLLSPKSATSEMVTEEVRRARELRDTRFSRKPLILPIRVQFPMSSPLNYDLRGYLNRIQQRVWESEQDTTAIAQEILAIISGTFTEVDRSSTALTSEPEEPFDPPAYGTPLVEVRVDQNDVVNDLPPLPVAEPELPSGQVDLASQFYVERSPIEANCYEAILKPGALIRIKAPRQMGKTSLMSRILRHGADQDCLSISLSFQLADAAIFANLNQCLRWFCASVGRRLRLPNKLAEYWDEEILGSKDNCTAYFEEYLLAEISAPLVLGLDEVDMVFEYPTPSPLTFLACCELGMRRVRRETCGRNCGW
ncbi:MAG: AAA-like domain-containing protein [Oculatellaceae cyanobacterium bins.114]|nr:AAA-like domain-containing protein [Oculatellaceae cyanobacterium bins.114]